MVKGEKVWSGKLGNTPLFLLFVNAKKLAAEHAERWNDFRLKNFILKFFQKLMPFQLLLDQDIFMNKV